MVFIQKTVVTTECSSLALGVVKIHLYSVGDDKSCTNGIIAAQIFEVFRLLKKFEVKTIMVCVTVFIFAIPDTNCIVSFLYLGILMKCKTFLGSKHTDLC